MSAAALIVGYSMCKYAQWRDCSQYHDNATGYHDNATGYSVKRKGKCFVLFRINIALFFCWTYEHTEVSVCKAFKLVINS